MSKPRVAILGASGIGKFHAREFKKAGADVVAILGTNEDSLKNTSDFLDVEYGIKVKSYSNIDILLASEKLDAVSICTPSSFHFEQTKRCLSESISVFSEKPIVQNNDFENYKFAKELIEIADRKKMVFTVNTQWPSVLQYLESYVNFNKIESFSMLMQPRDFGKDILLDQVPHTNSVLLQLIPKGVAQNIRFKSSLRESLEVFFDFISENGKCRVNYIFKYKETGQRELKMEFNGKLFSREVDKNYKQTLVSDDVIVPIPDPLSVSISKFVGALKGEDEVLINSNQMIKNIQLQDRIVKEFLEK